MMVCVEIAMCGHRTFDLLIRQALCLRACKPCPKTRPRFTLFRGSERTSNSHAWLHEQRGAMEVLQDSEESDDEAVSSQIEEVANLAVIGSVITVTAKRTSNWCVFAPSIVTVPSDTSTSCHLVKHHSLTRQSSAKVRTAKFPLRM